MKVLEKFDKLEKDFPFMQGLDWGCWDGWYDLLNDMCKEITQLYTTKNINVDIEVFQVKEKFGGLRFYAGNYIEGVDEIISKYETKSYKVCEICGEPGELDSSRGWVKTLCEYHKNKI